MKKISKAFAIVLAAAMMVTGLVGCGGDSQKPDKDYSTIVAATFGDEKIYLDEANFMLRYMQWNYEASYWDIYQQMMGYPDLWIVPFDEYHTMADSVKEMIMQQIHQTRVLCSVADKYGLSMADVDEERCKEAAHEVFAETAPEFFEYAPVTEEKVTEWFKLNALAVQVHGAICDAAEVSVSDEDCEMFSVKYVYLDGTKEFKDADGTTLTAEDTADKIEERVAAGGKFDEVIEAFELTASSNSYTRKADADTDTSIGIEARKLAEGETCTVPNDDESGLYVVLCTSEKDEAATADKRASLEEAQKSAEFDKVYVELQAAAPKFSVTSAYENLVLGNGSKIYVEPATEESTEEGVG